MYTATHNKLLDVNTIQSNDSIPVTHNVMSRDVLNLEQVETNECSKISINVINDSNM